ncbi:MAG: SUMF1/EgtB/PvdO family nonheme iron enzyme [Candidatus Eremiobacteraeota bacterium]|nr:SUMF1/EgtB/PvdO family nonheme iron enzyme [Candidatus Eremiobacteraeota bacterium]
MIYTLDRQLLVERYQANRRRTAALFGLLNEDAHYERPLPLRHPFIFYEGHVPAFSFNTLCDRALGEAKIDEHLQRLFERGIDPGSLDDAGRHGRDDWPSRERVEAFARECDRRVVQALLTADIDREDRPMLRRAQSSHTILEHETMHQETTLYILHQLDRSRKKAVPSEHRDTTPPANEFCTIGAGSATLGVDEPSVPFAWDNEMPQALADVAEFSIMRFPITNGEWLKFLDDGGPKPEFWVRRDAEWLLRTQFDQIRLPRSWPVYVTHRQAAAYARWAGLSLPTEAEYHRAAFGTPSGYERSFPWGEEPPAAQHGNFDFRRFDPEPVDAHPAGASAWGVEDLVGNGWEWSATPFAPFEGFAPMASYPQYSADFFDGKHFVMKGASPVTSREFIRRSFRNWFYDDYPYMYAKFRCVSR